MSGVLKACTGNALICESIPVPIIFSRGRDRQASMSSGNLRRYPACRSMGCDSQSEPGRFARGTPFRFNRRMLLPIAASHFVWNQTGANRTFRKNPSARSGRSTTFDAGIDQPGSAEGSNVISTICLIIAENVFGLLLPE